MFIPWQLVYGGAGWTATVVARTGYLAFKAALLAEPRVGTLYVDDVERASRYSLETLRFDTEMVERLNRRLIGISDGHDSAQPQARTMLHFRAMMAEGFIVGLRAKVRRGQRDGFDRDEVMEPPAFGYRLVPRLTADGRPALRRNGSPRHDLVIDEGQAAVVREVFRLYVEDGRSPRKIATWLNDVRAGGRTTWREGTVKDLLRRHVYVGIRVRGMERQRLDPETGAVTLEQRPVSEWQIRRRRDLQIVPRSLWKAARTRLAERMDLFRRGGRARADAYPVTLFRPVCGACGAGMILGRGGTYPSFFCLNSRTGASGCTHRGYKSVRILEAAVLGAVRERLFGDAFLDRVVAEANTHLESEARRPRPDLEPLRRAVREAVDERQRLTDLLLRHGEEGLSALVERLRDAERRFGRLRELLEGETEAAAPLLRDLIGTVVIRQEAEPGAKRPVWFAEFTLDLAKVAVRLGGKGECPGADSWESLRTGGWTPSEAHVRARAEQVRTCDRLAARATALAAEGLATGAIARRLGTDWATADAALASARGERRPVRRTPRRQAARPRRPLPKGRGDDAPFRRLAPEAARLRGAGLSYREIGRRLGVSPATAARACAYARPEAAEPATGSRGQ